MTGRQTERQGDRATDRVTMWQGDRQRDNETGFQTERQGNKATDREKGDMTTDRETR